MITIQKYVRAESLEEAYRLNQQKSSRIIAGMLWVKLSRASVGTAIDISGLGLDKIEETDDSFSIGAMVSLRQIEQHEGLNRYTNGAAADAVKDIVGVQFRNMATVGGSIWGRFGFSDVLTFFMSTDCSVELYNAGIVPLEKFAYMDWDNDILVRLIVRKTPGAFVYKAMRNQRTDFPITACAISNIGGEYRAVIGARPMRALVVRDENNLLGGGITAESAAAFGEYVSKNAPTGGNARAGAEYRSHLIKVLTERATNELGGLL